VLNFIRIFKAFFYSLSGLKVLIKESTAFKQEILLSFFILPAAFYFGKTSIEIVVLCFSWFLVLVSEMINTAIEKTIDRFGEEIHPISKEAKDIASASVFLAISFAIFVWIIILV
tara:strand:+ start:227 stop:571 length:345 start_codon:yes stop_codon:yes gene_type:complete